MILAIGVTIAFYVIARCLEMMSPPKTIVRIFCTLTILVAAYGMFVMTRTQHAFIQELQRMP
jgi:hypothetical protein